MTYFSLAFFSSPGKQGDSPEWMLGNRFFLSGLKFEEGKGGIYE